MSHLNTALMTMVAGLCLIGCRSNEAFNASLHRATTDISRGHLDGARSALHEADSLATGTAERQKVADLTAVVSGAEAMIDGRSHAAAAAWSSVEDPGLRFQLKREAAAMGLQLDSNNQEDSR
jgi:hypothetical protein